MPITVSDQPKDEFWQPLDLSKGFDMVNHTILLQDIYDPSLPNNIKRWLAGLEFRDGKSNTRQGVP